MLEPIRKLCVYAAEKWNRLQDKVNEENSGWSLIAYAIIPIAGPILLYRKKAIAEERFAQEQNRAIQAQLLDAAFTTTYILAGAVAVQAFILITIAAAAFNVIGLIMPAQLIVLAGASMYTAKESERFVRPLSANN